jgi:hypothetical protein
MRKLCGLKLCIFTNCTDWNCAYSQTTRTETVHINKLRGMKLCILASPEWNSAFSPRTGRIGFHCAYSSCMYIMYFTILASLSCTLKHLSQFLTLHVIERDHSSQISYNVEIGFAYFPLRNLQDSLAFCKYKKSNNYKFLSFFRLPFVMVSALTIYPVFLYTCSSVPAPARATSTTHLLQLCGCQ